MIEIYYKNKNVECYCKDFRVINKYCGNEIARKVFKRLCELSAFNNVNDLLSSGIDTPHLLTGNFSNYIAWDIDKRKRLIIKPLVNKMDLENIKECTKVMVEGVIDYHGGNKKWIFN